MTRENDRRHPFNRLRPHVGFVTLSAMVLMLFGFTLYKTWGRTGVGGVLVTAVMGGLLYELSRERRRLSDRTPPAPTLGQALANFAAVLGGALVAYILNVDVGLGPVSAAGLVGLAAALVLPDYGVPLYCGAFAGMTSAQLLVNHGELALAGAVAGVTYVLAEGIFDGFGGKLGTIAFTGTVITGFGLQRTFSAALPPEGPLTLAILVYAVVAAVATYALSVGREHGGVLASSAVGLLGGLILPHVHPTPAGNTLAVVVICASFTGMSSPRRCSNALWMALAGLITGLMFVYSMPLLGGAGGKLGTLALGSILSVRGYLDLWCGPVRTSG